MKIKILSIAQYDIRYVKNDVNIYFCINDIPKLKIKDDTFNNELKIVIYGEVYYTINNVNLYSNNNIDWSRCELYNNWIDEDISINLIRTIVGFFNFFIHENWRNNLIVIRSFDLPIFNISYFQNNSKFNVELIPVYQIFQNTNNVENTHMIDDTNWIYLNHFRNKNWGYGDDYYNWFKMNYPITIYNNELQFYIIKYTNNIIIGDGCANQPYNRGDVKITINEIMWNMWGKRGLYLYNEDITSNIKGVSSSCRFNYNRDNLSTHFLNKYFSDKLYSLLNHINLDSEQNYREYHSIRKVSENQFISDILSYEFSDINYYMSSNSNYEAFKLATYALIGKYIELPDLKDFRDEYNNFINDSYNHMIEHLERIILNMKIDITMFLKTYSIYIDNLNFISNINENIKSIAQLIDDITEIWNNINTTNLYNYDYISKILFNDIIYKYTKRYEYYNMTYNDIMNEINKYDRIINDIINQYSMKIISNI